MTYRERIDRLALIASWLSRAANTEPDETRARKLALAGHECRETVRELIKRALSQEVPMHHMQDEPEAVRRLLGKAQTQKESGQ